MRRPLVTTIFVMALALLPATLHAQTTPPQQTQPPQQQPPAGQQPPAQPQQQPPAQQAAAQTLSFASEAGMIFNQIKPDQAAVFEEGVSKLKEALAKSTNPVRKQQAAGWKVYKAAEPMGGNTLYVFVMDPAVKGADYRIFQILSEGLGDAPAREIFEKIRTAYAAGQNIINLSPIANLGG